MRRFNPSILDVVIENVHIKDDDESDTDFESEMMKCHKSTNSSESELKEHLSFLDTVSTTFYDDSNNLEQKKMQRTFKKIQKKTRKICR